MGIYSGGEMKSKGYQENRGFTLIEILVATAIFIIAILVIGGIFVSITKAQRRSKIEQRVQAEARYALETMAREIQKGKIDYEAYGGTLSSNLVTTLNLKRPNRDSVAFTMQDDTLKMTVGGVEQAVLSGNITMQDLQFYITPREDPFAFGAGIPDEQPRVTISFLIKDKDETKIEKQTEMKAQTTVSVRIYKR